MKDILEIIGLDTLDEKEQIQVRESVSAWLKKLETRTHARRVSKVKIHIKEYHERGNRTHSIKLDVILDSKRFEADSADWILSSALRKAFSKISEEIEHKFHNKGHEKN